MTILDTNEVNNFNKWFEQFAKVQQEQQDYFVRNIPTIPFQDLQNQINNLTKPFNESKSIIESFMQPIRESQDQLKNILYPIYELNKKVQEFLISLGPTLESQRINRYLYNKGWIVSPFLNSKSEFMILYSINALNLSHKEITKIIELGFSNNNYYNLREMVDLWNKNPIFVKRQSILNDVLSLIILLRNKQRNIKGINISRVIIPLLIAQIDGILHDYVLFQEKKFNKLQIVGSKTNKESKIFEYISDLPVNDKINFNSFDLLDFLFSTAYPKGQEKDSDKQKENPKTIRIGKWFNRHKIMHGEDIFYGSIDNTYRLFLILDILANLIITIFLIALSDL